MSGSSSVAMIAAKTSRGLCGAMVDAMATAMPEPPFTSRFGKRPGSTTGSIRRSSKLGRNSTVSLSRSASMSTAAGVIRHSV
jgi:hypothetical protein